MMTATTQKQSSLAPDALWREPVTAYPGGQARLLPLLNFAGRNYPALHIGLMARLLALPAEARLLELIGPASFLPSDNILRNSSLIESEGAWNASAREWPPKRFDGRDFFAGTTEKLPFESGEFDFVFCRGGLEQSPDPAAACRELQRVARRGFLETPSPTSALFGWHPALRWLVTVENEAAGDPALTFRPRPFLRAPMRYALRGRLFADPDFRFRWEWEFRNLVYTQFVWDDTFAVRVETSPNDERSKTGIPPPSSLLPPPFNYDDPAQAAESYLDSAINAIRFGSVPHPLILNDANAATQRRPDWAIAHNVRGCALWLSGKPDAAIQAFRQAAHLEPTNPDFVRNARLSPGASGANGPRLTLLPPDREDREDITENFAGKVYYAFVNYDDRLAQDMNIRPGEKVLDVGSGQRPLQRADVCVDFDVFEGLHRQGQTIARTKPLVCGDVQKLPFATKAFDAVCCRMVLEHVLDPAAACRELQRVARRGFLETPNTLWECFYGHPTHRWLIEWEAATRTLVFRRKPFDAMPFRCAIVPLLYTQGDIQRAFEVTFRNATTTQIAWDEDHPFQVRVEDDPDTPYDYLNRTEDAIRGSLNYSRDLLESGLPSVAVAECEDALRHAEALQTDDAERADALLREALSLRLRIAEALGDNLKSEEIRTRLIPNPPTGRDIPPGPSPDSPLREGRGEDSALYKTKFSPFPVSAANESGKGAGGLDSLLWRAPLRDPSGYADEARHFLFALEKAGVSVAAREVRWSNKIATLSAEREAILRRLMTASAPPNAVSVCHILAPHFQRDPQARANVGRTMFETDRLPAGWVEACNQMDAVWVPSEFNRQTFTFAGVKPEKLRLVPGAIDLTPYNPNCTPLRIDGLRGFNFLSVFDWTLRKGWDVMLRAFIEEFRPEEDVALLIKTHSSLGYTTQQMGSMIGDYITGTLGQDLNRIPDIVLQDSNVPDAMMPNLYRSADCYVMPTRGEGWGRPYMEAMAMGIPVIATNWSGQTAFITTETGYLLDYELVDVPETAYRETPTYQGHRWAEPSLPHLRALMRRVFEEREEGCAVGQRARAHLEKNFTYTPVAQIIQSELERLV